MCAGLFSLWAVAGVAQTSGVARVVDGDTIHIGDVKIRLQGIDAPETDQTCRTEHGLRWACGAWVTQQVRALYDGTHVTCVHVTTDRYGRSVSRCAAGGEDIGQRLVRDGLAYAYLKYSFAYEADERTAAAQDRGLHGFHVQTPAQFRVTRAKGRIPPDSACKVKGNISQNGRIFHVPGQSYYERTGINESRGERWFCSEKEALHAGWRKAFR